MAIIQVHGSLFSSRHDDDDDGPNEYLNDNDSHEPSASARPVNINDASIKAMMIYSVRRTIKMREESKTLFLSCFIIVINNFSGGGGGSSAAGRVR